MELEFLANLATDRRTFTRKDRAFWPDKADAQRLIAAGYAKPAEPEAEPKAAKKS